MLKQVWAFKQSTKQHSQPRTKASIRDQQQLEVEEAL